MNALQFGPRSADFIWATGIENSFVPQTRRGHRALDEYQLMGHYQHWREDLSLARDLGMKAVRWGVPWYRVEPIPGEFDWRWTDQVLPYMAEELGITPIIDLMHYGCPFWLQREFVNGSYPSAVSTYAAAFAERYKGMVRWYTPCNEPLMTADLCGRNGAWPPYLRGDKGYVRLMLSLIKGIISTVEAIKAVDAEAKMVHVEASGICRTGHPSLEEVAKEHWHRGFLAYDLVTGRVTPGHPLYAWLVSNGARHKELAEIAGRPVPVDVMGLNFYPQWSTQEVYIGDNGNIATRVVEEDGAGFSEMVGDFYTRYGVPIMITETSARDSDEIRANWLQSSLAGVKSLRARGVPVLGYTWFPLFTMVDWKYRWGSGPLEQYMLELGLYQRSAGSAGSTGSRWQPTPAVEQLLSYINNPQEAVGDLAVA